MKPLWLLLSVLLVAGGTAAAVVYAMTPAKSAPAKALTEKDVDAIVEKRLAEALAKRDAGRVAGEFVAVGPVVKPRKAYTFDEAWAEAKTISTKLNEEEPKRTEDAVGLLGSLDQGRAAMTAKSVSGMRLLPVDVEDVLYKYGLRDLVQRKRRELAFEDHPLGMKTSCLTLWQSGIEPRAYAGAAEFWGGEWVHEAIESISRNRFPQHTGGVLLIERLPGGKEWLAARRK